MTLKQHLAVLIDAGSYAKDEFPTKLGLALSPNTP